MRFANDKYLTPHILAVLLTLAMLTYSTIATADEGGTFFWFLGQDASNAASPNSPGWSVITQAYNYNGRSSDVQQKTHSTLLFATPTYTPETKLFGGIFTMGIGFGFGKNTTDTIEGISPNRSETIWGFSDPSPVINLAWTSDVHNWLTYFTVNLPAGAYKSTRIANIGIGHYAIDGGGAYTYSNEKTGREFSAVLGFTYNYLNPHTDYKNGIDSHIEWAASQTLCEKWQLGLVGYALYQLTGDSGSGATRGSFRSRVASIGPEIAYNFTIYGNPTPLNLRGYKEFGAKNAYEGYTVFLEFIIPLGPPAKKSGD